MSDRSQRRAWRRRAVPAGIGAIALVAAIVVMATAAGQGLDEAAGRHVQLLSEGRLAEARRALCDRAQPIATDDALRAAVAGRRVEVTGTGTRGTGVDGIPFVTDRGHAFVEIAFDGRAELRRFAMRREQGTWKVCPTSAEDLLGRRADDA